MKKAAGLSWLIILVPIAALFGPALATQRSFAFRDAGHFYYPLFEWCANEWAAGRIPLWNPQENCGLPVVADATSSVFYPGKLVFLLPIEFATRYKLFVVGHVLLAAASSYWLARAWRSSAAAAAVAAIAFAYGGAIVFQYSNAVFLVGASWLPLAALAGDRTLHSPSLWSVVSLAVALAMMVLGGDPQTAYHALLALALYALVLLPHGFCDGAPPKPANNGRIKSLVTRLALVAMAAAGAYLLASVQILPAREAIACSERATFNRPRNIYEAVAVAMNGDARQPLGDSPWQSIASGLFGEAEEGSHHELAYDFSVGPWRLVEYFWPNIGGRMFPTHRRWMSLLPAEGRVWTPTLYLGLLPALLALGQLRFRGGVARKTWLTAVIVLFTLGSFGYYGLGWFVHEIAATVITQKADHLPLGNPVGGMYWLMVTLLPGYAYFRYPAKLLPLVSLAVSQLAAMGVDELAEPRPRWRRQGVLLLLASTSAVVWAVIALVGPQTCADNAQRLLMWIVGQPAAETLSSRDPLFGPFNAAGAYRDVLFALLQTTIIAASGYFVIGRLGSALAQRERWKVVIATLTAIDVAVANAWLVTTAPVELWKSQPAMATYIRENSEESVQEALLAPRVYRGNIATRRPNSFKDTNSPQRPAQIVQWERETLFPKHHLSSGLSLVDSYGSIKAADYESLLRVAKEHGPRQPDKSLLPQPTLLRLLGVEYLVLPQSQRPEFAERIAGSHVNLPDESQFHAALTLPEGAALWRMKKTLPRAWIVHDVELMSELPAGASPTMHDQRSSDVMFPADRARDFAQSAVVESNLPLAEWRASSRDETGQATVAANEQCAVIHYDPQRVSLDATLSRPGMVVLTDAWHPSWKATMDSSIGKENLPVYRTNRIFRGVWLPAGRHTIEFSFRLTSFERGAYISGLSWLLLGAALVGRGFFFVRRQLSPH